MPDNRITDTDSGDDDLAELGRGYRESLRGTLAAVEQALATGDHHALATVAHQTRGAAGMFGYPELTVTAGLLEDAIHEQQNHDLIDDLARELVRGIQGILKEGAASRPYTRRPL